MLARAESRQARCAPQPLRELRANMCHYATNRSAQVRRTDGKTALARELLGHTRHALPSSSPRFLCSPPRCVRWMRRQGHLRTPARVEERSIERRERRSLDDRRKRHLRSRPAVRERRRPVRPRLRRVRDLPGRHVDADPRDGRRPGQVRLPRRVFDEWGAERLRDRRHMGRRLGRRRNEPLDERFVRLQRRPNVVRRRLREGPLGDRIHARHVRSDERDLRQPHGRHVLDRPRLRHGSELLGSRGRDLFDLVFGGLPDHEPHDGDRRLHRRAPLSQRLPRRDDADAALIGGSQRRGDFPRGAAAGLRAPFQAFVRGRRGSHIRPLGRVHDKGHVLRGRPRWPYAGAHRTVGLSALRCCARFL